MSNTVILLPSFSVCGSHKLLKTIATAGEEVGSGSGVVCRAAITLSHWHVFSTLFYSGMSLVRSSADCNEIGGIRNDSYKAC